MQPCNGNCLNQCVCDCYDEETEVYDEICTCGHRSHDGYCPSDCCEPVKCRNFAHCGEKHPQWCLYCHNGMCMGCAIQMGPHEYSIETDDCCVCLENKRMLILKCNHRVCTDCWFTITKYDDDNENNNQSCPLCRGVNKWGK